MLLTQQAQLLRDSQLLEEVGGQRSLEETRLTELRKEVQIIEQDKLSLVSGYPCILALCTCI